MEKTGSAPVALITGVSRGIGLAIAQKMTAGGYRVFGCASTDESLAELRAAAPDVQARRYDVSRPEDCRALAAWVTAEAGRIDALVNNAGRFVPGDVLDEGDDAYEAMLRTNLDSAYYLTKAVAPQMKARRDGLIINICSIASIIAYPNGGSYGVSKFGMLGLTRLTRETLKPHGVRVSAILPGATLTHSWAGADVPPERLMPPEDVAEVVWTICNLSRRTVVEEVVMRPQEGDLP